mmetsp:Transcript_20608/g.42765  ORF Transcript_20608/g.42765 Transcript_20608/m.42765 type:complete len:415 (+) Transcript_20608:50-1294(+)
MPADMTAPTGHADERRCPVSGRPASSGSCPMARATAATSVAAPLPEDAKPSVGPKESRDAIVREGMDHLELQDHVKAMKAFTRALELDPADEEAGRGKVLSLQGLRRPRGALRSCLISLSYRPESKSLLSLRDELMNEVGSDSESVMAEAATAVHEAENKQKGKVESNEAPDYDSEASTEAVDEEPGCPASRAQQLTASDVKARTARSAGMEGDAAWLASKASADYRAARKAELVDFYRDFYRATSNKTVSTSQYSAAEKNGLSIKGGHRYMPRPAHIDLPEDYGQPVGMLTASELKAFDGRKGRLLLCVHGDLFDVSDRPDKYGPEGPYSSMAGHDITWALWSGYDMEDEWDKHFDLHKARSKEERDRRFQGLMSWWAFFEQEYGSPVGRLDAYDNEWMLPAPPVVKDLCVLM